MSFSGVNYLAVVVAAVAAFVFGAIYYGALSKPWMKAARITPKPGSTGMMPPPALLINSIVCELIMAWVLAVFVTLTGGAGVWAGIVVAFFAWLGFMATTVSINQRYQGYGWNLTVIDALHWLGVAVIMGAILGWWS